MFFVRKTFLNHTEISNNIIYKKEQIRLLEDIQMDKKLEGDYVDEI